MRSGAARSCWPRGAASWKDATENGDPTPINDRRATELIAAAQAEHVEPGSFLDYRPVFGDLGTNTRLRDTFVACRASLVDRGARATVSAIADF